MAVARAGVDSADNGMPAAEWIQGLIDRLVAQRQQLRSAGAAASELEANRLAIVYWQRRLGSALAARAEG